MTRKAIILGGLGNGSVIANAIIDAGKRGDKKWHFEGYLNDGLSKDDTIKGHTILGKLADAREFVKDG